MTAPHTCTNCNCPKCLIQRAGHNNPALQQALADAWVPEQHAWGLPAVEEYPVTHYQDQLPQQRAYADPANPLNYGVDRYPRLARPPILGVIPRHRPQDAFEWFLVGMAGTVVLSIIGVICWVIYQIKMFTDHTGEYLAAHGTQIFSGVLAIGVIGALAMLCGGRSGGGGRSFSGNFTGRMH